MAGGIGLVEESSIKKRQILESPSSNAIKVETAHRVHLRGGKDGDVRSVLDRDSTATLSFISPRTTKMSVQTFCKLPLHVTSKCTAGTYLQPIRKRAESSQNSCNLQINHLISTQNLLYIYAVPHLNEGHPGALDSHHTHRLAELQVQDEDLSGI